MSEFLREYQMTVSSINTYSCSGIFDYAEQELPHLLKKEKELDNKINEEWDADLKSFKNVCQDYKRTILIILGSMGEK